MLGKRGENAVDCESGMETESTSHGSGGFRHSSSSFKLIGINGTYLIIVGCRKSRCTARLKMGGYYVVDGVQHV